MNLAPFFNAQFFEDDGTPLVGGQLWTYEAGTVTPATTYEDQAGDATNENPITLDAAGRCDLWLDPEVEYDLLLLRADDSTVASWESVSGVAAVSEVVASINGETGEVELTADDIEFTTATTTDWFSGADVTAALDAIIEQVDAVLDSKTSTKVSYSGASALGTVDIGKTHYKTDASAVTITGNLIPAESVIYIANANGGSTMTVTQGVGMSLYANGQAASGSRTIALNSVVRVWFIDSTTAMLSGSVT
jgi:hypothetical protein